MTGQMIALDGGQHLGWAQAGGARPRMNEPVAGSIERLNACDAKCGFNQREFQPAGPAAGSCSQEGQAEAAHGPM